MEELENRSFKKHLSRKILKRIKLTILVLLALGLVVFYDWAIRSDRELEAAGKGDSQEDRGVAPSQGSDIIDETNETEYENDLGSEITKIEEE